MTSASTDPPQLTPQVLDRLRQLQQADRPVSVDEILKAANLDHLAARQPHASKSAELRPQPQGQPRLEKSVSISTTLAERRKIPSSPEKLKLYAQITTTSQPEMLHDANHNQQQQPPPSPLQHLKQQNELLSPQPDEEYLISRIEKQSALLSADPKSMCIESTRLQADLDTLEDATIDDWQFWEYVVHDFATAARELPHLLAAKLRHGGIPGALRGVVWRAMCMASATHLESIYDKLVREEIETSPYERVISRDLTRTFPQVELFQDGGEGQQAMGRLLRAYSVYDAHVGYCQGLAFLAGPLLMTMPEKEAFCTFVRLMETYDMRTMFTLNMEGLHLRLHQFSTLLAQVCPRLEAHLTEHSIHPPMYASQWFLTLFAYTFPIELVLRIYDIVFAQGAVETITRVAIAVMQRNEDQLLAINDFEKLMMHLSSRKLYEDAFNSDPEQVIAAAMDLSAVITKQKMDSIAESHYKELALEKDRTQQVLAIRFANNKLSNNNNKSKRESWFSRRSTPSTPTSPTASGNSSSSLSSSPSTTNATPRNVQLLHQQIEELVLALSQLQKDHSRLSEEMLAVKMREMDHDAEKQRLLARNHMLEKRIRKYKGRLSMSQSFIDPEQQRLKELERDEEFRSFVNSLRMSGDFGALIAGALSSEDQKETDLQSKQIDQDEEIEEEDDDGIDAVVATSGGSHSVADNTNNQQVHQELEKLQAAHEELTAKYQDLQSRYQALEENLKNNKKIQQDLVTKMNEMQQEIQDLHDEKEQLLDEREDMEQESRDLEDKLLAAKKTASELQLEKMTLAKDVERLEKRVEELEKEKQEYLMPRGSFSEEVFAAHQTLFGEKKQDAKQNGGAGLHLNAHNQIPDEYQQKYIESELRCRELEKLLAETKCRLVEYEAASPISPRVSLQQPPLRRRSTTTKRSSTASLSMLASNGGRMSTPTSPGLYYDRMPFAPEPRESTDSLASSASGVSKRSSMYSRIWSSFSTAATSPSSSVANKSPVLSSTKPAEELLVEEPHEI